MLRPPRAPRQKISADSPGPSGRLRLPPPGVQDPFGVAVRLPAALEDEIARSAEGRPVITHILSLTPFRSILKDYFLVCETYYAAIRTATPSRIEAIDMGRRGLHNEGAQLLLERLRGKIETDLDTARRIFTLVTALHWRG